MERKGEGKPPETLCFLSKKRKGVEAYSLLPQAELRPVQYSTQSALGGGVLSCSESTPVLQGSHHILFTIVCGWRKKKKKRGGSIGGKENLPLCAGNGKESLCLSALARKSKIFSPHANSTEHLLLFYAATVAYVWASRAGKQRHPGFSWWWELTSD